MAHAIRSLIFDLDGVLVDSKEIHFLALNLALAEIAEHYVITTIEQDLTYEGLTTLRKLEILHELKGLPKESFNIVWKSKQLHTAKMFKEIKPDQALIELLTSIKNQGILLGVVSNSIRQTLEVSLSRLGIRDLIDVSISNEDVTNPKPEPEGYLLAMSTLGVTKDSVAIFEDSAIGREAATKSGATLVPVNSRIDLTTSLIENTIRRLEGGLSCDQCSCPDGRSR